MIPASFDYIAPESLDEAVRLLAAHGEEAKLLAGGHSLLPLLKARLVKPKLLVDLGKIPDLGNISQEDDEIVVGALTTHYQIESAALLKTKCSLLPETARTIGDVQVRNRGTIGGSLAHADPSADWPAAILALGGELKLIGPAGERRIVAEEFFLSAMTTVIEPTEILTEIRVPVLLQRSGSAYLNMAQQASGFAIVGVAVWLRVAQNDRCEDIGIGVTGLSEKPFRARPVEEQLRGNKLTARLIEKSAAQVAEGSDPLEDLHASAKFRVNLARVYTSRAIHQAAKKASGRLGK
ncbi:MAG TPA: xanthine dehydrogenase family protein subunit M [Candidatus Binatia bacterium]|nr:xanthine dehydrogenase family protein subunit M [Candidatus Binatia bacterium]